MIIATAGHVDHGKTSLVRALTGVDTDRLPEEKRRGMTIDLGFAYRDALGFVDVPGHERFIHNMLCGVAGIDFVLLVIAADDGPMPQTREHLAILDLLGVARGAVALTKIDRVAPERVAEVRREIDLLLASTVLAGATVFAVSSVTGEGMDALRQTLNAQAQSAAQHKAIGNFRLSVDRCFTIAGAGLVVTGTAMSGEVSVGDEVQVLLAGSKARVRSIHAHNTPAPRGGAGQRLALNLVGLDAAVARGDWIVRGSMAPPVRRFDARLRPLEPIKHWTPVHVHLGAADVLARVALLNDSGMVQIVSDHPMGALRGDGFIVRDQSARRTLGGGRVIDVFPPARGRARPERLAWLAAMELDDDHAALEALLVQSPSGVDLAAFAANRNLPPASGRRFSAARWKALREQALQNLASWHERFPDAVGPAADRLVKGVPPDALAALVDELARERLIVREALGVRLASHRVELSESDAALWKTIQPQLAAPRPPSTAEIAAALNVDAKKVEALLSRVARQGMVERVSKNRFFLPASLRSLERVAAEMARGGEPITAASFRDRSGIGRNLSIEVLEYFDRIKFTRRIGDTRVIAAPHGRDSHPGGAHGLQIR
jgi:selenocysteine-specific elongation factor